MNKKKAFYLILYGGFLVLMGVLGYLSNPEKARTALMAGGTFGALSILWGVLGARGFRWAVPAALVTTALLTLVFSWRATVGWQAVIEGQSEKRFAALLLTVMLVGSVAMLVTLCRSSKPKPTVAS